LHQTTSVEPWADTDSVWSAATRRVFWVSGGGASAGSNWLHPAASCHV